MIRYVGTHTLGKVLGTNKKPKTRRVPREPGRNATVKGQFVMGMSGTRRVAGPPGYVPSVRATPRRTERTYKK